MSPTARETRRVVGIDEARTLLGREFVVPGSIANLGSGFDALAVAVQLYLRVRVARVGEGERKSIRSRFGGVALEGEDYVVVPQSAILVLMREEE